MTLKHFLQGGIVQEERREGFRVGSCSGKNFCISCGEHPDYCKCADYAGKPIGFKYLQDDKFYWYEDTAANVARVGRRGGTEYTMDLTEFKKECLRAERTLKGRPLTAEHVLQIVKRESQYVEFEEVKPEVKALPCGQ